MYLRQAGLTRNPTFSYLYSVWCRGQHVASEAPLERKYSRWLLWCLGTVGRLKTKELKIILAIGTVYLLLNIFVTIRINKSDYLNGERRGLHKRLIWLIPFLGPMLILRYWTKSKPKFETMTKQQREKMSRPEIGLHELTCKQDEKIRKNS